MKQSIAAALILAAIIGGANAQGRQPAEAVEGHPFISVEYADTFQGVQGMFAVRACVAEDDVVDRRAVAGNIPNAPPLFTRIAERKTATEHDIVVRVVDADGRELSRHEGAANVCGYARLASAFLTLDGSRSSGGAK